MHEPCSSRRPRTIAVIVALAAGLAAPVHAQVMPEAPPSPSPSPSPSAAPTGHGPKEPIVVRDHRTVRSYPANLGHNVVEVWNKESLLPLLIGTGATAVSFLGDNSTIRYFDRHPMKTYGDVGKFLGTGVVAAGVST